MVQYFLNCNTYRRPTSPNGNDKTGAETAFVNAQAEFKRIVQQSLGG
jgi:hypothetical protein